MNVSISVYESKFASRNYKPNYLPILKRAYTKLIGIDPEIIQVLLSLPQKWFLLFSSLSRQIQPDIINEDQT
jgi:hypothetical protein